MNRILHFLLFSSRPERRIFATTIIRHTYIRAPIASQISEGKYFLSFVELKWKRWQANLWEMRVFTQVPLCELRNAATFSIEALVFLSSSSFIGRLSSVVFHRPSPNALLLIAGRAEPNLYVA